MTDDKRYKTPRWKRVRLSVLSRDNYTCWVTGCSRYAKVADHIIPVHRAMSDADFYGQHNLRASCMPHNVARGVADSLARDTEGVVTPIPSPYSFSNASRSLSRDAANDRPVVKIHTQRVITGDYSRNPPEPA